ncbi:hypothetical protein GCM10023219_30560 [Stakelama sediminis]|uniref:TPR repeat protein n=1 Tax=Stakelama sediminis TaxID=463200 RepID=A0A840Z215_9SPHN|nr:sel1 repeat family protein [Stakelama sediminis]MBB5720038.1 TPR repeat protein [Stakelama sediminis]
MAQREPDMERIRQAFAFYEAENFTSAIRIWFDLAELGSVWSMIEVGRCYQSGRGVPQNSGEAEQWFKRAFAGGSQIAMLKCARSAYAREDHGACEAILQIGVNQDWTPAIFWQAWYRHRRSKSKETYRTIFPMLRTAARRGHPAARMVLASCMMRGKFGLFRIPKGIILAVQAALEENFDAGEDSQNKISR